MIRVSKTAKTHPVTGHQSEAPAIAGDKAYRLFCRPDLSPHRSAQFDVLVKRARVHLERANWFKVASPMGQLQVYGFDPAPDTKPGRNILLVHGWTSEAAFMSAFIEPLRRHGHRLTLFDMPAHGRSPGRAASLMELARATHDVANAAGPFDIVIAHSIGGIAALLAAEGAMPLPGAVTFGSIVLIATPNRFNHVTRDYGRHLNLGPAALRFFERRLERIGHRSIASMSAQNLLHTIARPGLIVHARDDTQVPFSDAEEIVAHCPAARLVPFDDLGHAGVLFAPPAIRTIRSFCAQDDV